MLASWVCVEIFRSRLDGPILLWPRPLPSLFAVLVSLGDFIGLSKSVAVPQTRIRFLGLLFDSVLQAFIIPEDKNAKFATLRQFILQNCTVSIKTLQCFAGKITSFSLAVPAAQSYAKEIYRAISRAAHSSRPIKVIGDP